jgi:hypothetical protein
MMNVDVSLFRARRRIAEREGGSYSSMVTSGLGCPLRQIVSNLEMTRRFLRSAA